MIFKWQITSLSVIAIALLTVNSCSKKESTNPKAVNVSKAETTLLEGQYKQSVDALCAYIREEYIYFDESIWRDKSWNDFCAKARTFKITDKASTLYGLEWLIDKHVDKHMHLGASTTGSPYLLPSHSDAWVSGEKFTISALRAGTDAAKKLRVGDMVISKNDLSFEQHYSEALQRAGVLTGDSVHATPHQIDWAINRAFTGYRGEPREFVIERGGEKLKITLEPVKLRFDTAITYRLFDEGTGYIRFNDSLGGNETVSDVFAAIEELKAKGAISWVLDLRETPSGGSTDVAEPIMGRFINKAQAYQHIGSYDVEPAYDRYVEPAGDKALNGKVVVLVGRWTGSMGEGMAIGFNAMKGADGYRRSTSIGSEMGKLRGGVDTFQLEALGISVNIPTYELHHLDGTPREEWVPENYVNADQGTHNQDEALNLALTRLQMEK